MAWRGSSAGLLDLPVQPEAEESAPSVEQVLAGTVIGKTVVVFDD